MIRFLLDQGIPRSAKALLKNTGWGVVHVGEIDMSRAADVQILEYARREKRIIVTLDADFHAMLAVTNASDPSVIRLRRQGLDGRAVSDLLRNIWSEIEDHAVRGAMITVTVNAIRVRRLPVSRP